MASHRFSLLLTVAIVMPNASAGDPIRLHPSNPHYFLYDQNPTVLITSAEHYGAVVNADFDYATYLQTLHDAGLNYTRIFTGTYVEVPGSFGIQHNTLAPTTGRFLAPWKRTDQPGPFHGEPKWDLDQWNEDYFDRLRDFISTALAKGVVVEVTLFCSTYQDAYWKRNPQNPSNNLSGLDDKVTRLNSLTLADPKLTAIQTELVQKIVRELNPYDNVIYEIQNEPWSDHGQNATRILRTLDPKPGQESWFKWAVVADEASLAWQKVIAQTIVNTEATLPKQHLIAQNYSNFKTSLRDVDANVSILNFHYAWPEAVVMNLGWRRPIGFDESGFAGSDDVTYLDQA